MNILSFIRFLAIYALLAISTPVLANSSGLLLNDDSVQVYYQSNDSDTLWKHSRQELSLIYSQEANPRDLLLSMDVEPLDYRQPLLTNIYWGPKLAAHIASFEDENLIAAAAGIYIRHPAQEEHDFDFVTELLVAPQMTNFISGEWLWSFKAQINLPLPDNAELNFGFRKIQIKLDDKRSQSFETGLYVGLSRHF